MMARLFTKLIARLGLPASSAFFACHITTSLHWPWWLSTISSLLLFWKLSVAGRDAVPEFLEKHGTAEIPARYIVQFLARHMLWQLAPFIAASVAYMVFPLLLPQSRGSLGAARFPSSVWEIPTQLERFTNPSAVL